MKSLLLFTLGIFLSGAYFGACVCYVLSRWNQRLMERFTAWGRNRINRWYAESAMRLKRW